MTTERVKDMDWNEVRKSSEIIKIGLALDDINWSRVYSFVVTRNAGDGPGEALSRLARRKAALARKLEAQTKRLVEWGQRKEKDGSLGRAQRVLLRSTYVQLKEAASQCRDHESRAIALSEYYIDMAEANGI